MFLVLINLNLVSCLELNNITPQTLHTSKWSFRNIWNAQGNSVFIIFPYALNNAISQHCFFLFLLLHEVQTRSSTQNLYVIKKKCKDTKWNVKSSARKCSLKRIGVLDAGGEKSSCSPLYIWHLQMTLYSKVHNIKYSYGPCKKKKSSKFH